MPPVYIQESHWNKFNKIEDFLSPGDSASFIFMGRDIDSTILSKNQSFQIESWLLDDGLSGDLHILYHGSWNRC